LSLLQNKHFYLQTRSHLNVRLPQQVADKLRVVL